MAGITDFLPLIGNIFDSYKDSQRYDDAAGMTREQLEFQKELINKSSEWQSGNNADLIEYILANNPLQEEETAGLNEGQFDMADWINSLRSGFANDVNEGLDQGVEGARNLSGSNLENQEDIANQQAGSADDILSIAMGRDPSSFIKQSERMAGELGDNAYNYDEMLADATQAAQLANDRVYGKQMDVVSRDSARAGTDASGALMDLSSQAARDAVEATLKARMGMPAAYESAEGARMSRLGSGIQTLEGAAGGIDTRAMAGLRSGVDALSSTSNTLSGANKLGIDTLLHKPEYEDPSRGLANAYDKFKSVIGSRTNPYASSTNPYSSAKPAIPATPSNNRGSTIGDTISYGIQQLLSGGSK